MKKLLGIVLTLLLLISLMACAAKENVDTQVPDEQQVPAEDASVPAETEFLILERPDDAIESLEWAKEQTWDKSIRSDLPIWLKIQRICSSCVITWQNAVKRMEWK